MTELEVISAVAEMVTSAEGVTNFSLSQDQIGDELDTLRVRMIAEMDAQSFFRRPYQGFTQRIASIKVTIPTDKTQKPYIDVPRIVMLRSDEPAVLYIGGKDDISPYRVVTGDWRNAMHDMFLETSMLAHYQEGRITFYSKHNATVPQNIRLIAVFEDPSKLEILGEYNAETSEYPVNAAMLDMLIGKTTESYLRTMYRIRPQSNTQSDIPGNAGPKSK